MADMLLTNTLSTPMVYFNSYGKDSEELSQEAKLAFDTGVRALERKVAGEAISSFTKVIHEKPNFAPAINNLGALYYSIGRVSESVYFLEDAIKKNPKDFQSRYNLGTLYCLNRGFEQAKNQLSQARALFPNDPAILNNLAISCLNMSQLEEASQLWQGIMDNYNKFDLAFHNYAHLLCQKEEYEQAEEYYKKAMDLNNQNVITANDLACCYYKSGKVQEAILLLTKIIESTAKGFQPAIYNLGYIAITEKLLPAEII
jgi:Flp pilus assembly protein TadD